MSTSILSTPTHAYCSGCLTLSHLPSNHCTPTSLGGPPSFLIPFLSGGGLSSGDAASKQPGPGQSCTKSPATGAAHEWGYDLCCSNHHKISGSYTRAVLCLAGLRGSGPGTDGRGVTRYSLSTKPSQKTAEPRSAEKPRLAAIGRAPGSSPV